MINPGGCFVNADHFAHVSDDLKERYRLARRRWMRADDAPQPPSGEKLPHGAHYNGSMEQELSWLKEAGCARTTRRSRPRARSCRMARTTTARWSRNCLG